MDWAISGKEDLPIEVTSIWDGPRHPQPLTKDEKALLRRLEASLSAKSDWAGILSDFLPKEPPAGLTDKSVEVKEYNKALQALSNLAKKQWIRIYLRNGMEMLQLLPYIRERP